jgi:hypothetical protein
MRFQTANVWLAGYVPENADLATERAGADDRHAATSPKGLSALAQQHCRIDP